MLTSDYLDGVPDNIVRLYRSLEDSVISDMVRRLVKMDYVTSSAAWQMQRVIESGAVYEDVLKKLAGFTGKSEKELADAFSAAGVKSLKFDDSIYKAAGLDPLPLNLSPQMAQVLANGLKTTNGLMQNITRSTALSAQRQFLQASDLAYLQVSSGAFSYDQAIKAAVKGIGESGLGVVYPSGRVDQLDVAVRRAVLTGVGKTSGDLQLARASEMGQDLVETSAHIGARPTHAQWQGQVFSRSGTNKKYPDFVTSTGYGTALGLNGINCRHSFYPFFEGISTAIYEKSELESYANKTVTYNGKKMTVYEATQEQRAIERQIRSFKRQESALQAGGLDASVEAAKVRDLQAKMRLFTKQTGLSREYSREGGKLFSVAKMVETPKMTQSDFIARSVFSDMIDNKDAGFPIYTNRESLPPIAKDKIRVFHGTGASAVPGIKAEGIKAGSQGVVNVSTEPWLEGIEYVIDVPAELVHFINDEWGEMNAVTKSSIRGIWLNKVKGSTEQVIKALEEWKRLNY